MKRFEADMNTVPGIGSVASPTRPPNDFLRHETECRDVLRPWLEGVLDMAEAAGWNRRTAASRLMFLASQHVSSAGTSADYES
jgi:hypothetical protein